MAERLTHMVAKSTMQVQIQVGPHLSNEDAPTMTLRLAGTASLIHCRKGLPPVAIRAQALMNDLTQI